jgi:hypothetical protein
VEIGKRLWLATGGVNVVAVLWEPRHLAGTTSRSPSILYVNSDIIGRKPAAIQLHYLLIKRSASQLLRCLRESSNDLPHCALDFYLYLEYRYREFNAKGLVEIEGLGDLR